MPTYTQKLKSHLGQYRTSNLGLDEELQGIWSRNGKAYPHILPTSLQHLNILETVRSEFWEYQRAQGIKLHRDFAHLNSSQALAFNLFFPFFGLKGDEDHPGALLEALQLPVAEVANWQFEHVENREEGTNFDFFIKYTTGSRVFVEVKLTESEFGAGKANAARLGKLRNIYVRGLQGKVQPEILDEGAFFANYQLLRNISVADVHRGDRVIFLLPKGNTGLAKKAETFLKDQLLPSSRSWVSLLYLEDVLQSLSQTPLPPLLQTHVQLLREKYMLPLHNTQRVGKLCPNE